MSIPTEYGYLLGTLTLIIIWVIFYILRRDLRKEMVFMGLMIGVLSFVSGYHWWTVDWWRPATITGTRVGIEDFLIGFGSGGIMAAQPKFYSPLHTPSNWQIPQKRQEVYVWCRFFGTMEPKVAAALDYYSQFPTSQGFDNVLPEDKVVEEYYNEIK
mgnify:CR=1 FL=1